MGYFERSTVSPLLVCTWEQTTATELAQPVVPDACVSDDAVVYGPKLLAHVLRFRRLQALAPAPLALDAGYADQAHMTAEVTRLAGISPVRFLKDRAAQPA